MAKSNYAHLGDEGIQGFNWDAYDDGWNGISLKCNKRVRPDKKHKNDIIYSHESYAAELYAKMGGVIAQNAKDIKKGATLPISDIRVVDNDTISVAVGYGANNISVDLNKEMHLFNQFNVGSERLTKETFVKYLKESPEFKERVLSMDLTAKIGTDVEKGSMWDGYLESLNKELTEQITKQNKAYYATVIDTNPGGFVVEISNAITAFMPGSMAASNKITDYSTLVGRTFEVMVESWTPKNGFVVSRKKFIQKVRPVKLQPIAEALKNNPDKVYTGKVTGMTYFGIFVELDEYITGMLHKTLVSDEMREAMRNGTIEPDTEVQVYVHNIENGRVIMSDVPMSEREAVIARRQQEDLNEKTNYMARKAAEKRNNHNAEHHNNSNTETTTEA